MASKQTGLGEPELRGVEDMFEVKEAEQDVYSPEPKQRSKQTKKSKGPTSSRVKTSLALSQETLDLLELLKLKARKQKRQFVSFGELIDRAVVDLAAKMNVSLED